MDWAISRSHEWERVNSLPIWQFPASELERWRGALTSFCRDPGSDANLLDTQTEALAHWARCGYLFGALPVGSGKTLLTLLAMRFFPAARAVLMVPAALRSKTFQEAEEYRRAGWRVDPLPTVLNYEQIQTAQSANRLETLNPDILVCDEADAFKSLGAARTRRFLRFCRSRPNLKLMLLSGSFMRRSLLDFWHLLLMTHGRDAPVPLAMTMAKTWANAIDAGVDDAMRPKAGALEYWCTPEQAKWPPLIRARVGFKNRLGATPGVMLGKDVPILTELELRERNLLVPPIVKDALDNLYSTWETPNGDVLETGFDVWRHAREILAGFWYRWDPPPPEDWLLARRAWHQFVRAEIAKDLPGLDSPLQVAQQNPDNPLLKTWREVKPKYEIHRVPQWISEYVLDDAAEWAQQHPTGIVWVEHRTVGERLAQKGVTYFGEGKETARAILKHKGPMAASIHAHKKGHNLQRYRHNLIVTPPTSTGVWEQMLGRTYRHGQEETVQCEVYQHGEALQRAMAQAMDEADAVSAVNGIPQRLTRAHKWLPGVAQLAA